MAKGTATADPPVSKADVEQPPVEVTDEPVQEAEAPPKRSASKATDGTGEEIGEGKEPTSEADTKVQEPEDVKAARAAQAEADRRAFEAEEQARRAQRELNRIQAEQLERDQEVARRRRRELRETDPDALLDEYEKEHEQGYQAQRAYAQFEDAARTWMLDDSVAAILWPGMTRQERQKAVDEMEMAAARSGRRANNIELAAMLGDYRVRPLEKQIEMKDKEITELRQKVAALEGKRTGEIVEDGDAGPDTPADGRPGRGRPTPQQYAAATPEQRRQWREQGIEPEV